MRVPVVELQDFTLNDTGKMNAHFRSPLGQDQVNALFDLVDGDTYLTRAAIMGVRSGVLCGDMVNSASGVFADQLLAMNEEIRAADLRRAWSELLSGVRLGKEVRMHCWQSGRKEARRPDYSPQPILIGTGKTAEGAGHRIRNSRTVTFLLCTSSGGPRLTKGRAARYFRVIRRGGAVAKW